MNTRISSKLAALAIALMMNGFIIGGVAYLFDAADSAAFVGDFLCEAARCFSMADLIRHIVVSPGALEASIRNPIKVAKGNAMTNFRFFAGALALMALAPLSGSGDARVSEFSMEQVLHYPFATELAAAEHGDAIAWVCNLDGVRNVWVARGPNFTPSQATQYHDDDGQEITQLTFSPDGSRLVFVLGGDHDANWPAEGNLSPDPSSSPEQPVTAIWALPANGGAPVKIDEGDAPVISARGQVAYIKDDHVWIASLDGGKPERLFFDRGKDSDLTWSPDGSRLAFVSEPR